MEYPRQTPETPGLTRDFQCAGRRGAEVGVGHVSPSPQIRALIVDADVRERWWHKVDPVRRQTTNMVAALDADGYVVIEPGLFSELMEAAGWTPGKAS
ncbi:MULTISPECIES: hypothetical protein [unclassified Microbacterium]|uniref:hypothetical protein n=1 Tax=unclassified Microbacterium TaxID=2609290 RepID=UPI003444803B